MPPTHSGPGAVARATGAGSLVAGQRRDPDSTTARAAPETSGDRWESALFPVKIADGRSEYRLGCVWRNWGIVYVPGRWYRVTHLASGRRLTEFDRLRIARRFCERIDKLADWSSTEAHLDPTLGPQVHRAALDLTGARPALSVIDGDAR